MTLLRAVLALLGLGLLGLIVWAATQSGSYANGGLHGNLFEQGGVLMNLPWGLVAMADLYLGFFMIAVIIFLAERSWVTAAIWIAPILVLGNVWAVAWLIFRLPFLAKQLSRPDWPST